MPRAVRDEAARRAGPAPADFLAGVFLAAAFLAVLWAVFLAVLVVVFLAVDGALFLLAVFLTVFWAVFWAVLLAAVFFVADFLGVAAFADDSCLPDSLDPVLDIC
jgi:hypothetical protein